MNTAGQLCLSVLFSLLALAWGVELLGQSRPCSSLVAGVLYGSFSLRDVFPTLASGCSWTLENPDPTKYSLYFRFNRHAAACRAFSPMVQPLDHYLANRTCAPAEPRDPEAADLCSSDGPHAFLQFDKNFVQLCLTAQPSPGAEPIAAETLDFQLVETLLINNENSSQLTCKVLCRWFEECLRFSRGDEHCGITQTGCICPDVAPAITLFPATPHNDSSPYSIANVVLPPAEDCCVTELHSRDAIAVVPRDVRQGKAV